MKVLKPSFWGEKDNLISVLLLPISFLLQLLISIKNKFILEKSFKIPIICVGNIYVGGTGKTPLSITIAKELIKQKKNPAIIKKYYQQHFDEHHLIKDKLNCLFLDKKRYKAINNAVVKQHDVVILDDGFQDCSIKKNVNILCFTSNQLIGNGMTMPAGPLRENINAIKKAHFVVINGDKNVVFEEKILNISNKVKIFYSKYIPENIKEFKNKKIFAFAGIGNPENFFKLLFDNGINVKKKISFPDHYKFNKFEIKKIIDDSFKNSFEILTTEKDYFRIKNFGFKNIKFLKLKLEILNKDKLINQILNLL